MAIKNGYRHGVYTSEIPTSILPARVVDSAVVFAVGTAAVHTASGGKEPPVNTPRLYYSFDEFVEEMGWDAENFGDYTLQEVAYSHFALYRSAPLVCVNVFDPQKHCSEISGENLEFSTSAIDADTAKLAHGGARSLVLTGSGGESWTENVDYKLDPASGVVTRLAAGGIAEGAAVTASYIYAIFMRM